jgi:prepilin-type N-terminal cleavage/methylation domain-containing protein
MRVQTPGKSVALPQVRLARSRRGAGFTLVEIMIVLAILAIIMTAGIPSMMRALQRDDLARAVHDTVEGCKTARDRAILQGIPYEFILKADGTMNVAPAPPEERFSMTVDSHTASQKTEGAPYSGFPRKLGEDVIIQLVDVNFINHMQGDEARARFFSNGTCDEFTVVYSWKGKQRTVTADVVTGLVNELVTQ